MASVPGSSKYNRETMRHTWLVNVPVFEAQAVSCLIGDPEGSGDARCDCLGPADLSSYSLHYQRRFSSSWLLIHALPHNS